MRALGGSSTSFTPPLASALPSGQLLGLDAAPRIRGLNGLAAHLRSAEVTGRADAISGHLIGAELAAARPYWLGQSVVLIDGGASSAGHAGALEAQGVPVSRYDPEVILSEALAVLGERIG